MEVMLAGQPIAESVDIREDPVRDAAAIFVPCQTILSQALMFIPSFSVDQKQSEVEYVEIRQGVGHP